MEKIIFITQANDEGVLRMAKIDISSKENMVKDLKKFFTNNYKYQSDYCRKEYNINTASDDESFEFFKKEIYESFVDGDSYSIYQLFDHNCKTYNFPKNF